jgi:5-methylcytosine-specific restriction endonuclease McrA
MQADLPCATPHSHIPESATRYSQFRNCLRWDHGFTCPYCLLHESDLIEHGADGTGLISIEHILTQHRNQSLTSTYSNCVLACRFCNRSRGVSEAMSPGGQRLLNPLVDSWRDNFRWRGAELEPKCAHPDAARTAEVYDVNAPRKVWARERRAERIGTGLAQLQESPTLIAELVACAKQEEDLQRRTKMIQTASLLTQSLERSKDDLRRYRVIPSDAPTHCRCDSAPRLGELGRALESQGSPVPS